MLHNSFFHVHGVYIPLSVNSAVIADHKLQQDKLRVILVVLFAAALDYDDAGVRGIVNLICKTPNGLKNEEVEALI